MNEPESPRFRIRRIQIDPIEWSHRITIDGPRVSAKEARVVLFAESLDQHPLIEKALHERPDVVLILAPAIDEPLLMDIAIHAWASADRGA